MGIFWFSDVCSYPSQWYQLLIGCSVVALSRQRVCGKGMSGSTDSRELVQEMGKNHKRPSSWGHSRVMAREQAGKKPTLAGRAALAHQAHHPWQLPVAHDVHNAGCAFRLVAPWLHVPVPGSWETEKGNIFPFWLWSGQENLFWNSYFVCLPMAGLKKLSTATVLGMLSAVSCYEQLKTQIRETRDWQSESWHSNSSVIQDQALSLCTVIFHILAFFVLSLIASWS